MSESFDDALVCCMRVWSVSVRRPVFARERIALLLGRLGAEAGAASFDGFMQSLHDGALRPIGLSCAGAPPVSEDERALLDILALTQHGRRFEALLRLRQFAAAEAAPMALEHAETFGAALSRVGWFLDTPEGGIQRFVLGGRTSEAAGAIGRCSRPQRSSTSFL